MNEQLIESTETLEFPAPTPPSDSNEKRKDALVVRELPVTEWQVLKEAFLVMGDDLPNPQTSTIFVALELTEGEAQKVLGFVVMQSVLQIHVEPLFIYPEAQGRDIHNLLYDVVDLNMKIAREALKVIHLPYFVTLKDDRLIERAKAREFEEVDVKLFKKEV